MENGEKLYTQAEVDEIMMTTFRETVKGTMEFVEFSMHCQNKDTRDRIPNCQIEYTPGAKKPWEYIFPRLAKFNLFIHMNESEK